MFFVGGEMRFLFVDGDPEIRPKGKFHPPRLWRLKKTFCKSGNVH